MTWEGVSVDTLLDEVDHDAGYVLAFCDGGYTTNLPLEDVTGGKAWVVYSSRTLEDVIYRAELDGEEVVHTLRRAQPPGWTGYARRVDADLLREAAWPAEDGPLAFVCGPTSFVESVAAGLVELGYAPGRIKTERFGATGGR